jgi:hypothetical protein
MLILLNGQDLELHILLKVVLLSMVTPYTSFSGSLQEIRYFTSPLSESVFKDYIMNPHSTEGNSLNSSPDELIFRASLGGELYTGSIQFIQKLLDLGLLQVHLTLR